MLKRIILLLIIALILYSGLVYAGTVTLTANDVSRAPDIEDAIVSATNNGSEPGTVILDGSEGPFTYTDPDRSINISVSDLTLRGKKGAVITNCNDPVFFEPGDISNVRILGIGFIGDGQVRERNGAAPKKVTFQNNLIKTTAGSGILGSDYADWKIICNTIISTGTAINLDGAQNVTIRKNDLRAAVGVSLIQFDALLPSTRNRVVDNKITASSIGIILADGASKNKIARNSICLVEDAGIKFVAGSEYFKNRVFLNKVFSSGTGCCFELIAIDADPFQVFRNNKIFANWLTIRACTHCPPNFHVHKKGK